jgi:hypothetical protein
LNLEKSADIFIRRLSCNLQCDTVVSFHKSGLWPQVKECVRPNWTARLIYIILFWIRLFYTSYQWIYFYKNNFVYISMFFSLKGLFESMSTVKLSNINVNKNVFTINYQHIYIALNNIYILAFENCIDT